MISKIRSKITGICKPCSTGCDILGSGTHTCSFVFFDETIPRTNCVQKSQRPGKIEGNLADSMLVLRD